MYEFVLWLTDSTENVFTVERRNWNWMDPDPFEPLSFWWIRSRHCGSSKHAKMCNVADFITNFGVIPTVDVQNSLSSSMICILIPISTLLIKKKKKNLYNANWKRLHIPFGYLTVTVKKSYLGIREGKEFRAQCNDMNLLWTVLLRRDSAIVPWVLLSLTVPSLL